MKYPEIKSLFKYYPIGKNQLNALAQGKLQSELVDKIVGDISKIDEIDWSRAEQLAREYVASR